MHISEKINSLKKLGIKPGLERIKSLLGNLHESLKIIHVAGTNGKGSVCNIIASILKNGKYKTGLFTSPYLIDPREQIAINGETITQEDYFNIAEKIFYVIEKNKLEITEFEFTTALMIHYFIKNDVDVAVIETGMGGRLDSTNVFRKVLASVITSISIDHANILGDTIEKIAYEKSGIIKNNCPVVLFPEQKNCVIEIVKKRCEELDCKLFLPDIRDVELIDKDLLKGSKIKYKNLEFTIPLAGKHQILNFLTAIKTIEILNFSKKPEIIQNGLNDIKFYSRLQILRKNPLIVLDGAHNPSAAKALADAIELYLKDSKLIAIFGIMKDKDIEGVLAHFKNRFDKIITVETSNPRAMNPENLAKIAEDFTKKVEIKNIKETLIEVIEGDTDCIIFGSLYLAGDVLKEWKRLISCFKY